MLTIARRLLRTILMLTAALLTVGCEFLPSDEAPEPDEDVIPEGGARTIIAYFLGSSLSYDFNGNLSDMRTAVADGALADGDRLVVFRQTTGRNAEIRILYRTSRGECNTATMETVELEEVLTPEGLAANLQRIMHYAPAESYSVIFLGHSTAWLPRNPIPSVLAAGHRPPSTDKAPGAAPTRSIGEIARGESPYVILDIPELAEGLAATGVHFASLYFDVCFMGSVEGMFELRDVADTIYGSACEIMAKGSPYDILLRPLLDGDSEEVCRLYRDFYARYDYPSGCLAAVDCSKLDALAEVVKRIGEQPVAEDFDIRDVQAFDGRVDHWFFDLGEYCRRICSDPSLADELSSVLAECIPSKYSTDVFYSAYNNRFNDIASFTGITLTPDERCIDATQSLIDRLKYELAELNAELAGLEADDPAATALKARIRELNSGIYDLTEQVETLQYYNRSLHRTAWYQATH